MLCASANSTAYLHIRNLILIILTVMRYNPSAYNINSRDAEVFHDPARASDGRENYFGFSVALYVGANESLLLVGAPRANSSKLPSVTEPGTIFKCWNGVCGEWPIDQTGNGPYLFNKLNQIKDYAWIGATIAVENKTEAKVVVCGPRWIKNNKIYAKSNWYVNGICYATLASNVTAFEREATEKLIPLWDPKNQISKKHIYNYGMGQIGFSIHMISQQHVMHVVLGSPGVYNWKGNVVLMTAKANDSFLKPIIPLSAKIKQLYNYNYFGYAVTAGTYFNDNTISYASSAPKNANGTVLVFDFLASTDQNINIRTKVYGQVYGEYFGAALMSCDINNDRRQELIIGAPLWSRDMDEGRVYIYKVYSSTKKYRSQDNFKKMQEISGEVLGGRFGSAVMCLGDIDYDGYGDIAVGAPYEEETGGAVYIFNGNRDGVSRKYSQRLIGTQFSPVMRGFGISISEPRDVNHDNHFDIAVGAYLSGDVVLLRSMPVVIMNVTLSYSPKMKLLRNMTSFIIELWMSYEGAYVPKCLRIIAILQIDRLHGRAMYRTQSTNSESHNLFYTLIRSKISHTWFEIYLAKNIQNVIDPLEISVSMQVEDDLHWRNENSSCMSHVAVKNTSQTEHHVRLPFAVECGEDNICVADLGVRLSTYLTANRYIIGSTTTIPLRIDAYNQGEPAYQTTVRISTGILALANLPPECMESFSASGNLEVICDIGNPFKTNKTLMLQLDTRMLKHDIVDVELWANISTQNGEANWSDNNYVITLHFDVDVDIAIVGKAQESLYSYLREDKKEPPSSIRFQHFYEIQTFGVSPIEETILTVKIPTHIRRFNAKNIAIININDIIGIIDGHQFYCNDISQSDILIASFEEISSSMPVDSSNVEDNNTNARNEVNAMYENRTLHINCSSNAIECIQVDCSVGPFMSSLSVARFQITLDLQLANFPADTIKSKDIIYYVTEASITITQPSNVVQKKGHKFDTTLIATTFLGSPVTQQIAIWIITVSVILGVILLILLILALIKIGFFNRKKKLELEALKVETNKKYNVILETTSSREVLDHN